MKNSKGLNKFISSISIKSFGLFLIIILFFSSFKGQLKDNYVKDIATIKNSLDQIAL